MGLTVNQWLDRFDPYVRSQSVVLEVHHRKREPPSGCEALCLGSSVEEHSLDKRLVGGSNPSLGTKNKRGVTQ